jgi:hypothetical protein
MTLVPATVDTPEQVLALDRLLDRVLGLSAWQPGEEEAQLRSRLSQIGQLVAEVRLSVGGGDLIDFARVVAALERRTELAERARDLAQAEANRQLAAKRVAVDELRRLRAERESTLTFPFAVPPEARN